MEFEKVEIKSTTTKLSGNWICEISPYIVYGFTNKDGEYEEVEIHEDKFDDMMKYYEW